MNWREKKYYILEMRYRKNGFLMDEVEYYRSEQKAKRVCWELNRELKNTEEVIMVNKPFVGKGCHQFGSQEVYYTVSGMRRPMMPERKGTKGDVRRMVRWMMGHVGKNGTDSY